MHVKGNVRFGEPGMLLHPVIFLSGLQPVFEHLPEKPEVVIQPNALSGKPQGGNRVKETCRKPAQPAVAKGWFRLNLFQHRKALAFAL